MFVSIVASAFSSDLAASPVRPLTLMPFAFSRSVSGFSLALAFFTVSVSQLTSVAPVVRSIAASAGAPVASKFIFWKPVTLLALFTPLTLSVLPVPFAAEPPLRTPVTFAPPFKLTVLSFVAAPSPPVTELTVALARLTVLPEASPVALPPMMLAARSFSTVTVLPAALPPAASVRPPMTLPVAVAEPLTVTLFAMLSFCLSAAASEPAPFVQPP